MESCPLSSGEAELLRWLLQHQIEFAAVLLAQIDAMQVVSNCGCSGATPASQKQTVAGIHASATSGFAVTTNGRILPGKS